jgi:acyl-CoA dehydrogenase
MAVDADSFAQICDSLDRFVRERLIPNEERVEAEDEVPPGIVEEMKALGIFGLSIPEAYGGLGLSLAQEAAVMQILGRTAAAFRSVAGTNIGIGSQGIVIDGTEAQKAHYLPRLATGEIIASFALTEPDAGSDAAALRTTARREGDHYVLNGTKRYITNAPRAGLFTVMARSEDAPGAAGITAFLVPADSPGISLGTPDAKMGQRGTKTCDVIFENVRVPAEAIIGGVPGMGFKTAMKVLDRGRIHLAAFATGTASRLIDEALAYAHERQAFGQSIAGFQLIQAMLADSQTEYYAAKTMVTDAAALYDRQGHAIMEAACAKYYCTEMVGRVADRAVQIHGGAGYMAASAVERFYRDVRLLRLYEGTSQIQQLIIARQMGKRFHGR